MCMANNGKDANHTSHITRRVHFVRNGVKLKCTRLTDMGEFCNWHTLQLIILVRIN